MKRPLTLVAALAAVIVLLATFGENIYFRYIGDLRERAANVDPSDAYAYGETQFQIRGCAGCHQLDALSATGDTGPNLTHIGSRATQDEIRQSITNPNAIIAPNCPEEACRPGIMPPFGEILTPQQIDALTLYLSAQK